MKHLIGIECSSLDKLQEEIEKDFLGSIKYNALDEVFECRLGRKLYRLSVCHVFDDMDDDIEESFYIDNIEEEIR